LKGGLAAVLLVIHSRADEVSRAMLKVFLALSAAFGTTLIAVDIPELSRTSDVVVRGTVKSISSRWTADHARIVTDVELEVAEALKGAPEKSLTITQPGGVVGDVGQKVSGLASFQTGEEVLVFLERRGQNRFLVSGMSQGKFRIERSSDGRAVFAVPDGANDALLLDPATRESVSPRVRTLKLDELKEQVRRALKPAAPSVP
jgi:hypothetical protein